MHSAECGLCSFTHHMGRWVLKESLRPWEVHQARTQHLSFNSLRRAFDILPVRSKPIREKQYDEDDQDDADDTDAAVTKAIAVAPETATEAPKQEDDEYDDEYESE